VVPIDASARAVMVPSGNGSAAGYALPPSGRSVTFGPMYVTRPPAVDVLALPR
jgi:hypothetical protein